MFLFRYFWKHQLMMIQNPENIWGLSFHKTNSFIYSFNHILIFCNGYKIKITSTTFAVSTFPYHETCLLVKIRWNVFSLKFQWKMYSPNLPTSNAWKWKLWQDLKKSKYILHSQASFIRTINQLNILLSFILSVTYSNSIIHAKICCFFFFMCFENANSVMRRNQDSVSCLYIDFVCVF